jgi:hypothetical protein
MRLSTLCGLHRDTEHLVLVNGGPKHEKNGEMGRGVAMEGDGEDTKCQGFLRSHWSIVTG